MAVLSCRFSAVEALFAPLLTVVKATPVASFILLVLIWIGRGSVPAVIAALMVLPVVWTNVAAGVRGVDGNFWRWRTAIAWARRCGCGAS